MSSSDRAALRNVFGYAPTPDFLKFDPDYRQKHGKFVDELLQLQLELARQTANGRATPCSRQIFLEARWLISYTVAGWRLVKWKRRAKPLAVV